MVCIFYMFIYVSHVHSSYSSILYISIFLLPPCIPTAIHFLYFLLFLWYIILIPEHLYIHYISSFLISLLFLSFLSFQSLYIPILLLYIFLIPIHFYTYHIPTSILILFLFLLYSFNPSITHSCTFPYLLYIFLNPNIIPVCIIFLNPYIPILLLYLFSIPYSYTFLCLFRTFLNTLLYYIPQFLYIPILLYIFLYIPVLLYSYYSYSPIP